MSIVKNLAYLCRESTNPGPVLIKPEQAMRRHPDINLQDKKSAAYLMQLVRVPE